MKIPSILKLETGDAVASLDRCELINIGPIKDGSGPQGKIQFLTVMDENDVTLKVLLKDERYFLDPDKYSVDGKIAEGWMIELMAGPPKKGVSQGISYMADKQRIIVTSDAGTMKVLHRDIPEVDDSGDSVPLPLPEKPSVPQSTEKPSSAPQQASKRGPVDSLIRKYVEERIYIYEIVKDTVKALGSDFENISELATSIHINCERDPKIKEILPPSESKTRVDAARTNGHNPETPKAPVVEATQEEKKKSTPAETKAKSVPANLGTVSEFLCGCAAEEWYHAQDAKGNLIGDICQDDTRRAKVIDWFFSNSLSTVSDNPDTTSLYKSIKKMLDSVPRPMQTEMIFEGMRWNQAKIDDVDYSESRFMKFDEAIVAIVTRAKPDSVFSGPSFNPFAIAKVYYDINEDDRVK